MNEYSVSAFEKMTDYVH